MFMLGFGFIGGELGLLIVFDSADFSLTSNSSLLS